MTDNRNLEILTFGPPEEKRRRENLVKLLRECPIPNDELVPNIGLFLTPQTLSRILFMDFLYKQIVEIQGIVVEFGCRWGQNMALFSSLRGIYEPFNRLRKIIGFDTFEGFPSVKLEDGPSLFRGQYSTTENYNSYLDQLLQLQEHESPLNHIKKFEIIKGDVVNELPSYLDRHPETIVALAYFDLDIYEPTKKCLEIIRPHLTRGSILGFDEINDQSTPGETIAVKEILGLDKYSIRRYQYNSRTSYLVID
jgi:hypothetical protein